MNESSRSVTTAADAVQPILVPRETFNADSVYVVRWSVPDGTRVEPGAEVCEIETSKASVPIEAAHAGYLRQRATAGEEVPIGGVLGYITAEATTPLPSAPPLATTLPGSATISARARAKIEALGLDPALFVGRGVVRERDVLEMAASLGAARLPREDPRGLFHVEPLGPIQRRVARVMERSVATIPAVFFERAVDLAAVRRRAQQVMSASRTLVTPLDLLVAAVATAATRFPRFNAFVAADYRVHAFEQINVGVAVDVEGDLYVVVVKNVAAKSVVEIAQELRSLQYLAQRRRLTVDQLSGGTITVSSMLGRGVHRFHPLPYPEQAAIVGLADSAPSSSQGALALVFDHRVANGAQAAEFLATIADVLQGNG